MDSMTCQMIQIAKLRRPTQTPKQPNTPNDVRQKNRRPVCGHKCAGRVLPTRSALISVARNAASRFSVGETGIVEKVSNPLASIKHASFDSARGRTNNFSNLFNRFLVVIDQIDYFSLSRRELR
jgi:hypothetical protein